MSLERVTITGADDNITPGDLQWQPPGAEPAAWRGIFSVTYRRKVLFSKSIEIQAGKLRRWKPQITIDPMMTSEEDD